MALDQDVMNANFKGIYERLDKLERTAEDIKNFTSALTQTQKEQTRLLAAILERLSSPTPSTAE